MIHVTADDSRLIFVVTQERYYAASQERLPSDVRSWYIPLSYTTADEPNFDDITFTDYFQNNDLAYPIAYPPGYVSTQWFIFNKQQIGLYRVNYDPSNWNAIIEVLNSDNFEQIHRLNRAQLVDDALNLAADGYLDYSIALGVLSYLSRETDYIPWRAAIVNLDKLDVLMRDTTSRTAFRNFIRHLNRRMYATHNIEHDPTDSLMDMFARELTIDWTCRMGGAKCLVDTYDYVKTSVDENQKIPDAVEITYLCNGLRGLNRQAEFYYYWQKMQASNDQSERLRIINGLMCSSDPKTLKDLLETTLLNSAETYYRAHERSLILNNVLLKSDVGIEATINFIETFYNEIVSAHGRSTVDSLIIAMSRRIVVAADETRLNDLMTSLEGIISETTAPSAATNIALNKAWFSSTKYQQVIAFINDYNAKATEGETQWRLPSSSEPTHYKIHIDARNIPSGALPFTGEVEIDIVVKEATDKITFHSKNQVVRDIKVFNKNTMVAIPIIDYHLYADRDTLTIYFWDPLAVNAEIVVIAKYSSSLLTSASGFYRTSYVMDGITHYLGATQFESTNARYSFPCYDEPGFKTPYDLIITHDQAHTAIANMIGTTVNK